MALNYVWIGFFVIAFIVALCKLIFLGDTEIFGLMTKTLFESGKTGAEISIGLVGVMTFWLGIMKIGEKAGMIEKFARFVNPLFSKLFPHIPPKDPAMGSVVMNFSANMLGLDNAATPIGLKAMKQLQDINPEKDTASDAQIMFLVLNTAGLTMIPTSVMAVRLSMGAANPADIFVPTLIGTFISFLSGMIAVAMYQRINLFRLPVLFFVGTFIGTMYGFYRLVHNLPAEQIATYTASIGGILIFAVIVSFLMQGFIRGINVYDAFIEGAKEGFTTAVMIIPYLVAILVGIGVFRVTGCLDFITDGIALLVAWMGLNTDFVPALPVGIMKTFSGGAARGLMADLMKTHGPDSFVGRLGCIMQGSTETTFYILALYFGSVNIKKTRYALACGLIADVVGVVAAIIIGYIFFH
ncbi:nucleoside recognition domain-containing protein [Chitinophaga niabensis]|uniref:Spore maturation protein SpmA n=1 Tax=Chitinophaga niabensis TaxID=536979 RepID=A0A1N6EEU4_9BACT|nr:spore maturation protein [Chitinophaga niabensis]SIN81471.1 Spore maturation protein SpmA [Chitinophaga niabensis]